MDLLYLEATGQWSDEIQTTSRNRSGRIVHQEKHVPAKPEEAARQLLEVAMNATAYLSMLMEMNPGLCRQLAATQPAWPVMVDLRDADWQEPIAQTISKLELGKSIEGFLRSAQTSHRNIIRRWAAAIHETLLLTRLHYVEAHSKKNHHKTKEGCPEWARKTRALPIFTKASARDWARLGEEMLLEQMPSFLDHPDFVQKKRSWTHRARQKSGDPSPRAVRREAFEDFAKELKMLAPEQQLWKGEW